MAIGLTVAHQRLIFLLVDRVDLVRLPCHLATHALLASAVLFRGSHSSGPSEGKRRLLGTIDVKERGTIDGANEGNRPVWREA